MTTLGKISGARELLRGRRYGLVGTRVKPEVVIRRVGGDLSTGIGCRIGRGTHIAIVGSGCNRPLLQIGDRVLIGSHNRINVTTGVMIGDDSEISWLVQILDTDFHTLSEADGGQRPSRAPITIGRHVLIGTQSILTKGVTIGDGAVIGAGSVVTSDIPAGVLAAGNPARPIRAIGGWR